MSRIYISFILFLLSNPGFARTILVGKQMPVRSLRAALEQASAGDSIRLMPGVYKEGSLIISKPLVLIGEGEPLLHGENKYEILLISSENVTVSGIRFDRSGYSAMNDYAAIKVINSIHVTLHRNKISNAYFAIHVSNSTYMHISGNEITGSPGTEQMTGNGIHLWKCSNAYIHNNKIRGHRDGIYFEFVTDSRIESNRSEKNIRYGLHFMFSNTDHYTNNTFRDNGAGVAVMYSKKVTMEKNNFEHNWGASSYGLLLKDITDSDIKQNRFTENTTGIFMEGSSRLTIGKNLFRANGWAMKVQASCDDNVISENNFIGNSFDIGTNGSLVLNSFRENYWDKYEGYDLNRDNRGDVPYHPVTRYSVLVEQYPTTLLLFRSFIVSVLDKAEKAIPSLTPENLKDDKPMMKQYKL